MGKRHKAEEHRSALRVLRQPCYWHSKISLESALPRRNVSGMDATLELLKHATAEAETLASAPADLTEKEAAEWREYWALKAAWLRTQLH
jgi:hypothetical protein